MGVPAAQERPNPAAGGDDFPYRHGWCGERNSAVPSRRPRVAGAPYRPALSCVTASSQCEPWYRPVRCGHVLACRSGSTDLLPQQPCCGSGGNAASANPRREAATKLPAQCSDAAFYLSQQSTPVICTYLLYMFMELTFSPIFSNTRLTLSPARLLMRFAFYLFWFYISKSPHVFFNTKLKQK